MGIVNEKVGVGNWGGGNVMFNYHVFILQLNSACVSNCHTSHKSNSNI